MQFVRLYDNAVDVALAARRFSCAIPNFVLPATFALLLAPHVTDESWVSCQRVTEQMSVLSVARLDAVQDVP
jgi:hypothetical protein